MTIDITQICVALITLAGTVITAILVPYIKTKLTAEQQKKLQTWIQVGVSAAEQLSKTGVISKDARKQYVLDFLERHNMTADLDLIETMLEGAVYDLPAKLTTTEVKKLAAAEVKKYTEAAIEAADKTVND